MRHGQINMQARDSTMEGERCRIAGAVVNAGSHSYSPMLFVKWIGSRRYMPPFTE